MAAVQTQEEEMHEYLGEELVVQWRPNVCQHSGVCIRTLPQVYDKNARPWISPLNATTEQLRAQIDACPSGALTYRERTEQD